MPWGWHDRYFATDDNPPAPRVGGPDRGDRAKTKASRKANRQRRR